MTLINALDLLGKGIIAQNILVLYGDFAQKQEAIMLVINMKEGDYIMIGNDIKIHFGYKLNKNTLDLGVEAPRDVKVLRGALAEKGGGRPKGKTGG